jgi:antitoxin PrlF
MAQSETLEDPMLKSKLTSKGRITIPKQVRDLLGLQAGDQVIFRFDEKGRLMVEPGTQRPLGKLVGLLAHLAGKQPVAVEDMKPAPTDRRASLRQARGLGKDRADLPDLSPPAR